MSEELTYEQALEAFDERLRQLEDGKLSLEDTLKAVGEARKYLKICEAKLEAARGKIETRAAGASAPEAGTEAGTEPAPAEGKLF